jgi:hypothetical protein
MPVPEARMPTLTGSELAYVWAATPVVVPDFEAICARLLPAKDATVFPELLRTIPRTPAVWSERLKDAT